MSTREEKRLNVERRETVAVVDQQRKEPWHLSKSVPIAVVVVLIGNLLVGAGVWFTHVAQFEAYQALVEERFASQTKALTVVAEKFSDRVGYINLQIASLTDKASDRYRATDASRDLELRDLRISALEKQQEVQTASIEKIRTQLGDLRGQAGRIEQKLDAALDRRKEK